MEKGHTIKTNPTKRLSKKPRRYRTPRNSGARGGICCMGPHLYALRRRGGQRGLRPRRRGTHASFPLVRGRSADAETPGNWVVVQNVRAAMEKTRVRMKCMVKAIKFCGGGGADSRNADGGRTKPYSGS